MDGSGTGCPQYGSFMEVEKRMKMKRLLIYILCIACVGCIGGCANEDAEAAIQDTEEADMTEADVPEISAPEQEAVDLSYNSSACADWQLAYIDKLREYKVHNRESGYGIEYNGYRLYDINQDDVPELILIGKKTPKARDYVFYTFQDGQILLLKTCEATNADFYPCPEENALFLGEAWSDWGGVHGALTKLTLEQGELKQETVLYDVDHSEVYSLLERKNLLENLLSDQVAVQVELPILEYDADRRDEILPQDSMTEQEAQAAIEAVLDNEEKAYWVYGNTRTSFAFRFENMNMWTLEEVCRDDVGIPGNWKADIHGENWIDMNGDGRAECLLYMQGGDPRKDWLVILSAQDGMVYAYLISTWVGAVNYCVYYDDGVIGVMLATEPPEEGEYDYNIVRFYKNQIYAMAYKGDVNGTPFEWKEIGERQREEAIAALEEHLPDLEGMDEALPKGMHILDSCQGDIGNDNKQDIIVVLEYWKEYPASDSDEYLLVKDHRVVCVFTEKESGTWDCTGMNKELVLASDAGGIFGDPYNGIEIQDGFLTVSDYGGSAWRWGDDFTFGIGADGCLELCKIREYECHNTTGEGTDVYYDYTTGVAERYIIKNRIIDESAAPSTWFFSANGGTPILFEDTVYSQVLRNETITEE